MSNQSSEDIQTERTDSKRTMSNGNEVLAQSKDTWLEADESSASKGEQSDERTKDSRCRFTTPMSFLTFLCLLVIAQSCVVVGYTSAIQTSLQRQFGFSTNQYGVIVSSFEYTSIPSVLLISFFGHRRNRARLIAYGSLLIFIGCAVYVLPFVFSLRNGVSYSITSTQPSGESSSTNSSTQLCNAVQQAAPVTLATSTPMASCVSTSVEDTSFSTTAFGVLIAAQLLLGIGSSPIYTLGPTYLYDAVSKTRYSALISLMYAGGALGPALGFLMGALFLSVYVTPWRTAPPSQADFVGAWWIGLLVCCGLSLAAGLPLVFFPKRIRPAARSKSSTVTLGSMSSGDTSTSRGSTVTIIGRNGEAHSGTEAMEVDNDPPAHAGFGNKRSWTHFGPALKRIFTSRIWVAISVCLVAENSIVTGFVTYLAKYLQVVFHVATSNASIIAGVILIPAAVTGFLAGGVITQRVLIDTRRATLYMLFVAASTLVLLVPLGFLHCDPPQLAGVTASYPTQNTSGALYNTLISLAASLQLVTINGNSNYSLFTACNTPCGCSMQQYSPVCADSGSSRLTFYSACFAGCSLAANLSYTQSATSLLYYNCSCTPSSSLAANSHLSGINVSASVSPTQFLPTSTPTPTWQVTVSDGSCDTMCVLIVPFLVLMFAIVFLISSAQNAALILTLQSAVPDDRSFALGVQNFFVRLFAFIPAPIYFGAIFDAWCVLWSTPASATASCAAASSSEVASSGRYCLLTDVVALPYVVVGCTVLLKLVSIAACLYCWLISKRERSVELDGTSAQSIVSSAPSCISDLPTASRDSAVRYSVHESDNAVVAVAYRSNMSAITNTRKVTLMAARHPHKL